MPDEPLTLADLITAGIGILAFVLMFIVGRVIDTSDSHAESQRITRASLNDALRRARGMEDDSE